MWSYIRFMFWATLWIPIWLVTVPFKGKKNNCANWALNKWDEEGGYLCFRWCLHNKYRWIRWPHFMWLPKEYHQQLRHIVPIEKKGETHSLPAPWFDYIELRGDRKGRWEN